MSLRARAWSSLAILGVVIAALLFIAAGTIRYWQAWVFFGVFVGGSALATVDLIRRDPALLERRMKGGPMAEPEPAQRVIMVFTSLGFIALLVIPALDHRFGWSHVPDWVVVLGDALIVVGFAFIVRVYHENTYAGATIQVAEGQRVISTGPYAIVRHPMYASALLYVIGMPLALGSYWGLVAVAAMVPFLIWRLLDEERVLVRELPGYSDYRNRVKYRLLPFVW